jgi:hypothetical protein
VLTSLSTKSKKGLPPIVPEKFVMTCVMIGVGLLENR